MVVWKEQGNIISKMDCLKREGFFKNDKPAGEWKYYDEKGNLIKTIKPACSR
jgi:antitoxin component YwqK of YwqJK toxin-antitoxin module